MKESNYTNYGYTRTSVGDIPHKKLQFGVITIDAPVVLKIDTELSGYMGLYPPKTVHNKLVYALPGGSEMVDVLGVFKI